MSPLDPESSDERHRSILEDCQAKCMVTNGTSRSAAERLCGPNTLINTYELDDGLSTTNLELPLTTNTLASTIYTSGSTGAPKGVIEDHKYILRIIRAYSEDVGIVPDDNLILLFSLSSNGSLYLSLGYWNKPDLTRTRFLPDPNGGDERIYLTGDLGRMTPDGCFFHVGRKDFQIKIRGYRVDTGEVENILLAHPNISRAAVVGQQGKNEDTRLVAFYVPAHDARLTETDLRTYLRERVPEYMIPSALVKLDALRFANRQSGSSRASLFGNPAA